MLLLLCYMYQQVMQFDGLAVAVILFATAALLPTTAAAAVTAATGSTRHS
jgi:hypothetical protein